MIISLLRRNRHSLLLLAVAGAVTALITVAFPPQRDLESLFEFLIKLSPFVLAAEGIARLDLKRPEAEVLGKVALVGCFLVFFTWFVPQVFFYVNEFEEVYVRMQVIVPFVILTICLALRLGGASGGYVRRVAFGLLLLMVSGIEDLAFLTVNPHSGPPWSPIPDRWEWADHMAVRIGHYPTKYEAYAFISFHVAASLAVLFVPGGWVRSLVALVRPSGLAKPADSVDQGGSAPDPVSTGDHVPA